MDDRSLLDRYTGTRDASAFEELVQRYAGLVKATCARVLGNSHDAEEVAQECFLELAKHADQVHSSVAGWLHRAATSRSLNLLRSRMRRRVRERAVGIPIESLDSVADVTTLELHRIVEATVKDLPDDLRQPMIMHYIDGRSQREVATELGVNQSTISRRMRDALQQLREKLTQAGYVAAAPAITVLTQDPAAIAASGSAGTKVAVSGLAGKTATSATPAWVFKACTAAVLPTLSFLVFGGWVSLLVAICLTLYVVRYQPNWVGEIFAALGVSDIYRQPTFCLAKWHWTTPPKSWRALALASLAQAVLFLCLAFAFASTSDQPPWGTVVAAVAIAIGSGIQAARILHRVRLVRKSSVIDANPPLPTNVVKDSAAFRERLPERAPYDAVDWLDAIQLTSIGMAGIGTTAQWMCAPQSKSVWPSTLLAGTIGSWMLVSGIRLGRQFLQAARQSAISYSLPNAQSAATNVSIRRHQSWRGTSTAVTAGVVIVIGLSVGVVWNPAAVRGLSLSLAAIQTSMLGWMVFRVAARCQQLQPCFVRRVALILLISCFVLNSGVCVANWLQ